MRIVQQYYGPVRNAPRNCPHPGPPFLAGDDYIGYLEVDLDGRRLVATSTLQADVVRHINHDAYKMVQRELQARILEEIRKQLFG